MIGSTLMVEQAESEYREDMLDSLYEEAAVLVVKENMSRDAAIEKVQENYANRQEAERKNHVIYDEDGNIESFIDYDPVSSAGTNKHQVNAVKNELSEAFEILID